ncbi:MAG: ATPase domain-containing protein [Candidatus Diapherotrites archaeon]
MAEKHDPEVIEKLRHEFKGLPLKWIALIEVPGEKFFDVSMAALQVLVNEQDYRGVYITLNRPYSNMAQMISDNDINSEKLYFIDGVSKQNLRPNELKRDEKVIYIESIKSLTDLSIALTQVIPKIEAEKKFLFLDSISTLLIFNSPEVIGRFSHALTAKMRALGVSGAIVSIPSDTEPAIRQMLSALCDKVIKI